MKKIILLLPIIFLSCNNNTDKMNKEIGKLRNINDSLLAITSGLKDKYIFDEARIKIIPSEKNTNKLGSDYEGTFVVIAYNKTDEVFFSKKLDSVNGLQLMSPETLKKDFEGYHFNFKLNEKENDIHFTIKSSNNFGRNFNGMIISDKKKTIEVGI
ncbi:MAG: hypothetical protein QG594_1824 [Bacteroidota bacterium]|nr:hypothetical protein [Bacteroidota bacterium]